MGQEPKPDSTIGPDEFGKQPSEIRRLKEKDY
jgi:hypothetical protein